jgi:gamma-glutamyl hydrolase
MIHFYSHLTIFILLLLKISTNIVYIPKIAIFSNPHPDDQNDLSSEYVVGNYVRWLESAGAEVVVIHTWYSLEEIDEIMSKANGVLMQGGARTLDLSSPWENKAKYILDKVIEINDNGKYFPLWGTCQGFELLHVLITGTTKVLDKFNSWNIASPIQFNIEEITISKMFANFSEKDFENLRNKPITQQFHHLGISPESYKKYQELKNFFKITSFGLDRDSKVYIASVEAINYPIYAIQFHPERTPFDKAANDDIPQSTEALLISQKFGQFLVSEAKLSSNIMTEEEKIRFSYINLNQANFKLEKNKFIFNRDKQIFLVK